MADAQPLLSIVVTSRNDDHGGTLLRRTQTFLNALIRQCQRHDLAAELILVEWNPPPDRPPLAQVLAWPESTHPCQVRFIEVPAELHRCLKHAEALPLFQMIGKNVGIRRARGQYIVATNIDILFSDELMEFIKGGNLRPGRMYRIDRHDVMTDVPVDAPLDEQMRYCREHLLRINAREGTFNLTTDGQRALAPRDIATPELGVNFGAGWYAVEDWDGEVLRWVTDDAELAVQVPPGPRQALSLEMEPGPGVGDKPFQLQVRDNAGRTIAQGIVECRQRVSFMLPLAPGQKGNFTLHVEGGGRPSPNDPRILNFRAFRCSWSRGWEQADEPRMASETFNFRAVEVGVILPEDIAAVAAGVRFGQGWHALERWEGRPLRWVANDARLLIPEPPAAPQALTLEMHPGFGVDFKPFELQVLDQRGKVVAHGTVEGRKLVSLLLPLTPGQPQQFSLRVDGGDLPTPNDPRILNFCVWRCTWSPAWAKPAAPDGPGPFNFKAEDVGVLARHDIVSASDGISFGQGWHFVERVEGERFRWVEDAAGLFVQAPAGPGCALSLEVKPGPGVGSRTFGLEVRDRTGQAVARGRVVGRQRVSLLLPVKPGQTERFTFHVEGGGRRVVDDPRILNFRVFRCAWVPAWGKAAAAGSAGTFNFAAEDLKEPHSLPMRLFRRVRARTLGKAAARTPLLQRFLTWLSSSPKRTEQVETPAGSPPTPAVPAARAVPADTEAIVSPVHLHTNACGDFTLMERQHWWDINGYPEFEIYSLHIDSLGCYMAHHAGAREEMLAEPMRVYHIEHGAGSGWTPEGAAKLFERLAAKGIPVLEYRDLCNWATQMHRRDMPLIFNDAGWGFAAHDLPETIVDGAAKIHGPIRRTVAVS